MSDDVTHTHFIGWFTKLLSFAFVMKSTGVYEILMLPPVPQG